MGRGENFHINRGVELILGGNTKPKKGKTWEVCFGKMVSLFRREYHFFLKVSLDIQKK